MSNIIVQIGSMQQGFLTSIAQQLSSDHRTTIITPNTRLREAIVRSNPGITVPLATPLIPTIKLSNEDLIQACLEREIRYKEKFAMIASFDRVLGKGYIVNADRHPNVYRSWWPRAKKLAAVLEQMLFYEQLVEDFKPDLIVSMHNSKALTLVARESGVVALSLTFAKFGSRYIWATDEHLHSLQLASAVLQQLAKPQESFGKDSIESPENLDTTFRHSKVDFSYKGALYKSITRIYRESYSRCRSFASRLRHWHRSTGPLPGYGYLGWLPSIIRRSISFKYFVRHGYKPSDLADTKIFYFPLHLEPEVALLAASPEFNNSVELATWVSKSLPADCVIVIKEQPFAFGIRSKTYYDYFRRMPNAVLADPRVSSWDWIKAAKVVVTITGTAGSEAVFFERPVLSYGKHQIINHLPSVRFAHDYESTASQVNNLIVHPPSTSVLQASKEALSNAFIDVSFTLPGFERTYDDYGPQQELARLAIDQIKRHFPQVLTKHDDLLAKSS